MVINDSGYSSYLSRVISRQEDGITELKKELSETQARAKELKEMIQEDEKILEFIIKEKEDFINFQKRKKDGEKTTVNKSRKHTVNRSN